MDTKIRWGASSLAMGCAIVLGTTAASPAFAQQVPAASASAAATPVADPAAPPPNAGAAAAVPAAATAEEATSNSGEIVVTARKRDESILRTPIAVTALTSADLTVRGVTTLTDLSNYTPGVNVNNDAASRNDRSFQQLIIRGFTPSQANNPTASLFIDGAPVSTTSAFSAISDPERIEVLKGPQSAYFGRNTFAGAINVVNKLPGREIGGSIDGMIGTRSNYKVHADVSGPLAGDVLGFRLSIDRFSKDGSWRNTYSGETLGDQRTTSGTALLVFRPAHNFTVKAFGLLSMDHDGPPAQGLISAYTITDPAGNVIIPGQSNCTFTGVSATGTPVVNPYFCGVAPKLGFGPSANNNVDAFVTNFLSNPTRRLISPANGVHGYGLVRRYYHLHLVADYEIPGIGVTLSSLTSYNNERYSEYSDIDNFGTTAIPNNGPGQPTPGARLYYDFPFLVEHIAHDFSQEFRATYDQGGAFHMTVGGSYLNAYGQGGNGGGNGALGTTIFENIAGGTRNRTLGAFFGATYKFSSRLSLSLEGRYQIDKLVAYAQPTGLVATTSLFVPAGTYAGGSPILQHTYRSFLPRAIVQYNVTPDIMAYASYSQGVNPGQFNTAFLTFAPSVQQAAAAAGLGVQVNPEKVTNYEVGLKGKLFDNRLRFAFAAYYAPWRNQINALTISQFDPIQKIIIPVRAARNTGSLNMKGVELEGTFRASRAIDINFSGAINDSSISTYQNANVIQLTGITNFKGKENPNTSKYSAALGIQYNGRIGPDTKWFIRGDYTFKSGVWSDAANIVRTPNLSLVNARVGIDHGALSVSAFVHNLFDTHNYTAIADGMVLTNNSRFSTFYSSLVVGLPELRTFGVEARYRF